MQPTRRGAVSDVEAGMKIRKIFILVTLISLGLAGCDGTGPVNPSGYPESMLFAETWESYPVGTPPGRGWRWPNPVLVPYFQREVDIPSNHKLLLHGPDSETSWGYGGVYYPFDPDTMKPTYISYKVHPYPAYQEIEHEYYHVGHFTMSGHQVNANFPTRVVNISIRYDQQGMGFISANNSFYPGMFDRIPVDRSFQIELKNIQWNTTPQTFDLWINGSEAITCIEFSNPILSIARIQLYNGTYGRVHFDNIFMADLPTENTCFELGEPPLPDTMPIPPVPPTSEPVTFLFHMPAFCRIGPSTEYPEVSTHLEEAMLEITGQNTEGNWWWSEEGGCWVSDSVGELIGDITTLEIIIPPPPPAEEDTVDKDKGKASRCKTSLDKEACIKAGGTWDESPTRAGTCVCP
jgi:hypothetical protein